MARKISFENINFGYEKDVPLFRNLSFSIEQPDDDGYIVGLMGNSGSGKSTLLKLILGTERIWSGSIDIQPSPPVISYVPQEPVLFEHLTPLENALYFSQTKRFKKYFDENRFNELATLLGMDNVLKSAKSINEISGGQKQRISLLRALSINPDILLLDEPLTGLDERVKYTFLLLLARLAKEYNLLMIYVTHHRQEIELISNEIVFLETNHESGCVLNVFQNLTSEFFEKPPTLSALYLSKGLETNILPVVIDSIGVESKGKVHLYNNQERIGNSEISHICFNQDVIQKSDKEGWKYIVTNVSDGYDFLQLVDNQSIIVYSTSEDSLSGKKKSRKIKPKKNNKRNKSLIRKDERILLSGFVDIYINEKFVATKRIKNNYIKDIDDEDG